MEVGGCHGVRVRGLGVGVGLLQAVQEDCEVGGGVGRQLQAARGWGSWGLGD